MGGKSSPNPSPVTLVTCCPLNGVPPSSGPPSTFALTSFAALRGHDAASRVSRVRVFDDDAREEGEDDVDERCVRARTATSDDRIVCCFVPRCSKTELVAIRIF